MAAVFHSMKEDDEYMTPAYALRDVLLFFQVDVDKERIWEPFAGDGRSTQHLKQWGFTKVYNDAIFLADIEDTKARALFEKKQLQSCLVLTNPPFSKKQLFLERLLLHWRCPRFIVLLPAAVLFTQYFHELTKHLLLSDLKIVIPSQRIHYVKHGAIKTGCSFDSVWVCRGVQAHGSTFHTQQQLYFLPSYGPRSDLMSSFHDFQPYKRWCLCRSLWVPNTNTEEAMIECENGTHCVSAQWFHPRCVSLEKLPAATEIWYCPECHTKSKTSTITS